MRQESGERAECERGSVVIVVLEGLLQLLLSALVCSKPQGARAFLPGGGGIAEEFGERSVLLSCRQLLATVLRTQPNCTCWNNF